jgi:lipopolysaccharide transport system ATP-binding protein
MALSRNHSAVSIRDVHKWYRVYASPTERIKRVFGRRSRYLDIQALDGVSVDVAPGSAIGIIGDNGAGKSTLMKVVAGTTAPTAGEVEVNGVVAAILELGAAFHPEFSGMDNAVLYGALMGLDRQVMEAKIEDIVAFSELGEFVHHPVKSYSTGMAMRLAFAVATHVDPDVLVIDEALAVGDGYFQKKCVDKIREIKDGGTTILFCSHAMYFVTLFCERALWLARGRVEREGAALDVVEAYEASLQARDSRRIAARQDTEPEPEPESRRLGRITSVVPQGGAVGRPLDLDTGDELVVDVAFSSARKGESFHLAVTLDTLDGRCVLAAATHRDGHDPVTGATSYRVRFRVPSVPIAAGTFHIYAFLLDDSGLHIHDQVILTEALRFTPPAWTPSLIEAEHHWEWLEQG